MQVFGWLRDYLSSHAGSAFCCLTRHFMAVAASTLKAPEQFDLTAYQEQLIQRFSNPGLQHRTGQIAMDGSQKIPQRWLNSVRDGQTLGLDTDIFAFALAAWLRYLQGVDERGRSISISDPLAEPYRPLRQHFAVIIQPWCANFLPLRRYLVWIYARKMA